MQQSTTKRKIVLCKSSLSKRAKVSTANFGPPKCLCSGESPSEEAMTELILKVCEVARFHQQLEKVDAFHSLKARALQLRDSQQYLKHRIKTSRVSKAFAKIKALTSADVSSPDTPSHSNRFPKNGYIQHLELRVRRLEQIVQSQIYDNRNRSVYDILCSQRGAPSRRMLESFGEEDVFANIENSQRRSNTGRSKNSLSLSKISSSTRPRTSMIVDYCTNSRSPISRASVGIMSKESRV